MARRDSPNLCWPLSKCGILRTLLPKARAVPAGHQQRAISPASLLAYVATWHDNGPSVVSEGYGHGRKSIRICRKRTAALRPKLGTAFVYRLGRGSRPSNRLAEPAAGAETAAGTGIATRALRDALPANANLTATDLNAPMLDIAATKFCPSEAVDFRTADATALPFAKASFDAIVCQFGVMLFPDKDESIAKLFACWPPAATMSSASGTRIATTRSEG